MKKSTKANLVSIDGIEAHFILFAMDEYYGCNVRGKLTAPSHGASLRRLQAIRDKLFAAHVHPLRLYFKPTR